jgi:hypothetical protein
MKPFIVGAASLLLSIMFYSFLHDFNMNKQALEDLKTVCEEASVAGALFTDNTEYGEGRIVFNQGESKKAIEAVIIAMLELDDHMNPTASTYWQDTVTYKAYFYDDSNTTYPYLFTDPETGYTTLIKAPTVVVTINGGVGRYALPLLRNGAGNIRSSAHTWEGR